MERDGSAFPSRGLGSRVNHANQSRAQSSIPTHPRSDAGRIDRHARGGRPRRLGGVGVFQGDPQPNGTDRSCPARSTRPRGDIGDGRREGKTDNCCAATFRIQGPHLGGGWNTVTAANVIIQQLESSLWLLTHSISDFSDDHWNHIPGDGLPCAAWIVGHALLVDRQVLEVLEELEAPILRALPDDWETRFRSHPEDQYASNYYNCKVIFEYFVTHRHALIAAVSQIAATTLDRYLDHDTKNRFNDLVDDENPLFDCETIGEMILAAALYTYQLSGEMSVVLQSLGMAAIDDDLWDVGRAI